jgi:hypothetical protein
VGTGEAGRGGRQRTKLLLVNRWKMASAQCVPPPQTGNCLARQDPVPLAHLRPAVRRIGRLLQETSGGSTDSGDAVAIIVALVIVTTAVCAFLGWYSRRRG